MFLLFFFQAEDGIRVHCVTGVQTCALPILTVAASVRDTVVARNLAYIQGQGTPAVSAPATPVALVGPPTAALRSEERRVGKERRTRRGTGSEKEKKHQHEIIETLLNPKN